MLIYIEKIKVVSRKDDRGLIFEASNYQENENNLIGKPEFNQSDYQWFFKIDKIIESQRKQQKSRSQRQRQRGHE